MKTHRLFFCTGNPRDAGETVNCHTQNSDLKMLISQKRIIVISGDQLILTTVHKLVQTILN